jgi:hypothetical protein
VKLAGKAYLCVTCASSSKWTAVLKRLQKFGSRGTAILWVLLSLFFCLQVLGSGDEAWDALLLVIVASNTVGLVRRRVSW